MNALFAERWNEKFPDEKKQKKKKKTEKETKAGKSGLYLTNEMLRFGIQAEAELAQTIVCKTGSVRC